VVREGDEVNVKILRIDSERHRLGLSLKQAQADAEERELRSQRMVFGGDDDDSVGSWMGGARVIDTRRSSDPYSEDDDPDSSPG
jgi:transcriptional accessory protein Tex/SPT6